MKKWFLIFSTAVIAALLFASISAVSAKPNTPGSIDCVLNIIHNGSYWDGTVTGPKCSVAGTIRFYAVPDEYYDTGKTTHFVELFTIEPYEGGVIAGKNYGVWNHKTLKFRANGWVTYTEGEAWEHMVGYKYHETGMTSDPNGDLPLSVEDGKAKLVPANRQNAP